MGVMQCNVKDCESIMCHNQNDQCGYICDEHKQELDFTLKIAIRKLTKQVAKDFFEGDV